MAGDRTPQDAPGAEAPEDSGAVRPLRDYEVTTTLVTRLSPVVDRIRQFNTRFGLRPYRVFLVHVEWPGRRPGESATEPTVISRREILPTPRVRDLSSTSEVLSSTALTEEGGLVIDQISLKYSEDDLTGKTPDLVDPDLPRTGSRSKEFFYEVVETRVTSPPPIPRRYVPSSAPSREGFQWKVSLTKQFGDRSRDLTFNRRGP